jgi:hypothetical protein
MVACVGAGDPKRLRQQEVTLVTSTPMGSLPTPTSRAVFAEIPVGTMPPAHAGVVTTRSQQKGASGPRGRGDNCPLGCRPSPALGSGPRGRGDNEAYIPPDRPEDQRLRELAKQHGLTT